MIRHYVISRAKLSLAWVANYSFFTSLVCVCVCGWGGGEGGHFLIQACLLASGGKLRISSIRYQVVPVSSTIGIL